MEFTVREIAELWCAMSDDGQAQFFEEAAKVMRAWESPGASAMQPLYIGHHLRDCGCISDDARELVADIYRHMTGDDTGLSEVDRHEEDVTKMAEALHVLSKGRLVMGEAGGRTVIVERPPPAPFRVFPAQEASDTLEESKGGAPEDD